LAPQLYIVPVVLTASVWPSPAEILATDVNALVTAEDDVEFTLRPPLPPPPPQADSIATTMAARKAGRVGRLYMT
jgi:hypothetical protein